MLQGVQAEIGELLRLGVGVDGDDAAFIAKFIGSRHFSPKLVQLH
jgi:hypothetical protein